jgi:hypothetical protein
MQRIHALEQALKFVTVAVNRGVLNNISDQYANVNLVPWQWFVTQLRVKVRSCEGAFV